MTGPSKLDLASSLRRTSREVHFVLPDGVDDPARPSGGNTYDRRVRGELAALGWVVREHVVPRSGEGLVALADAVRRIPDGSVALLDGLIASGAPEVLVPEARRVRQVVLMHMPLGDRREREVLRAAAAIVTTSEWSRRRLGELYGLPSERVRVAEPGVDAADPVRGSAAGDRLLSVAAVIPGKGHDVLLDGLAATADLPWRCACVGPLDRDPGWAAEMRRRANELGPRVSLPGPRTGAALDRTYASADLLVHASHAETYGMVVTEALARGLPVLATDAGGVSEALGRGGLLVPPGDAAALGAALRRWLQDGELRERLRRAARERRATLRPWAATAADVAVALTAAARAEDLAGAA